ncbi:MAG TPA: hypothetical protein VGD74_07925, partial [Vulgatibacter sp.]
MPLRTSIARPLLLAAALLAIAPAAFAVPGEADALRVAAGPEDVAVERFEELRARLLKRIAEPGVAADLYELMDLVADTGSLERTADLLSTVARSSRAHAEVRALARRQLAMVERWRGRLPRMEAELAALGAVREVAIVGPFDDENGSGYEVPYGPERNLDLAKDHEGLRARVAWRIPGRLGRTGTFDLDEVVRPGGGVLIYAMAILDSPADTSATIYMGTPGATKAWLGGRPIVADPSSHPARFDQRSVPVRLKKGKNPLLLKLSVGDRSSLRLDLRVVGENGNPIPGLTARAPRLDERWPAPDKIPSGRKLVGRRPLVDLLEPLAAKGSARALEDLARVLEARRPFDDAARLDERAARRAADAAPERVEVQLLAARVHGDDVNERRHFLERAVLTERRGHATAHAALAAFWLSQGDAHRALEVLRPALAEAPGDWMARQIWARALDER